MSRYIYDRESKPVIDAANTWVQRCLIENGSIFGTEQLWTQANLEQLDIHFVQRLDAGSGTFYEKLETQLKDAPGEAKRLMAELLWALLLFPTNISIATKRASYQKVWEWSGMPLDLKQPMLSDAVLIGIGSGGPGINNHRWREVVYLVGLGLHVKAMAPEARRAAFATYDNFMAWIDQVPMDGYRQFRQMLRYFLFPDRVERMSSDGDRIKVLDAFGVAKSKDLKKWSDTQLDTALLELRKRMEAQYGTPDLDFYVPPLRGYWKAENEGDDPESPEAIEETGVAETKISYGGTPQRYTNKIFYGPPGTGKTYRLQQLMKEYTDQPADVDRTTWELGLVSKFSWRAVIATALANTGRPTRVADLAEHPLVAAKASERERKTNIKATLWGYLQEHTPHNVETVNISERRPPFIFTKNLSSEWSLVKGWEEEDPQSAELSELWKAGPGGNQEVIQRFRVVTFHPSYSYEDFVIGLRPVTTNQGEDHAPTSFRMVDGVFKQICSLAKANPSKRYALFIDEINRANIAKVFGELITLIESDKRATYDAQGKLTAGMEVQLPGTEGAETAETRFGVPSNLDIFGSMNTADRSIALLDVALRRRFEFEELLPIYTGPMDLTVAGVHLGKLLYAINGRLEFLADRDRLIGHAYFLSVKSLDDLRATFKLQIIPLLQEYFFDDWDRVRLVLSNSQGSSSFITRTKLDGQALFADNDETLQAERYRYIVTPPSTWDAEAFRSLYQRPGDPTEGTPA
ncbi:MAG: AAA family ATPase [Holophagaceae bacterium]